LTYGYAHAQRRMEWLLLGLGAQAILIVEWPWQIERMGIDGIVDNDNDRSITILVV
jgi:hypothetical protein